ncbi:helix-turn-helix domain-containing protein [Nocardiopsis synnemataformans]|uniref:helix-turn-helix domain-containing protein n=1 Tax=Nocardiopsis synnemataformans TaxID=61305 RepID=UPI003EB9BCFB
MGERIRDNWSLYGSKLRELRHKSGLSAARLGKKVNASESVVSKMERATRVPNRELTQKLMAALEAPDDTLMQLWDEADKADKRLTTPWHETVVTSEADATSVRMWAPLTIPGLFQTEEYARAIFVDGRPTDTGEQIQFLVDTRLKRAACQPPDRSLLAVIDESALYRRVGGPEVMAAQIECLMRIASQRLRITVLPSSRTFAGGLSGPFRLLQFASAPTRVYAEHSGGGQVITDRSEVQRIEAVWRELQTWALDPVESLRVMKEALRAMEHLE